MKAKRKRWRGRKRRGAVTVTPGIRRAFTTTTRDDPGLTAPLAWRVAGGIIGRNGRERERERGESKSGHDGDGTGGEGYDIGRKN